MAKRLNKVFVANRGEIALRVIRACREAGIKTVQGYSEADSATAAVELADESICIGGAKPADSYLNGAHIVRAALKMGADAVHPGYGFLSENADFCQEVEDAGLIFIGPTSSTIRLMGDKIRARQYAEAAGVPVSQGSASVVSCPEEAIEVANRVGYPVLIKASAGGGGRGMRVARTEIELKNNIVGAMKEAETAFGCSEVYIEKFLERIRHIEVQIFGDGQEVIHIGDRDCSIQRRHQKLLEEGPASFLDTRLQEEMREAARRLGKSLAYRGAGTVEFIVDIASRNYFFIEMNTRIQVEHPVTEMVSGLDLVAMQLDVAAGMPLGIKQEDVRFDGHAIEVRINAEDPAKAFIPRAGKISAFKMPGGPGVRVDTHISAGDELPVSYDSLIAKIIVWGRNREHCLSRLERTLFETQIEGVPTTLDFHRRLLSEPAFRGNDTHTQFIKEHMYADHPMRKLL